VVDAGRRQSSVTTPSTDARSVCPKRGLASRTVSAGFWSGGSRNAISGVVCGAERRRFFSRPRRYSAIRRRPRSGPGVKATLCPKPRPTRSSHSFINRQGGVNRLDEYQRGKPFELLGVGIDGRRKYVKHPGGANAVKWIILLPSRTRRHCRQPAREASVIPKPTDYLRAKFPLATFLRSWGGFLFTRHPLRSSVQFAGLTR